MTKRQRTKSLTVAILVDPMGVMALDNEITAEEEIENIKCQLNVQLSGYNLLIYQAFHGGENIKGGIKDNTDLIVFDFGGMMPGCDSLLNSNVREMVNWATDHPAGLIVVISQMTVMDLIKEEMRDLGLNLPNIVNTPGKIEIPEWWINKQYRCTIYGR